MKKILFLLAIALLMAVAPTETNAQKLYGPGYRTGETLTSATTVAIAPQNTVTLYTVTAAHNITFNATVTKCTLADVVVIKATASSSNRIMTFGTAINAVNDTIPSGKTRMYEFIYTGSAFDLLSKQQTD